MMATFRSSDRHYNNLSKHLEREQLLTKDNFREALRQASQEDRHVIDVLFELPAVPREKLLESLSGYFELPVVDLRQRVISSYVLNLIPKDVAEQQSVIIFKKIKDVIHVATTIPENHQTVEFIRKKTGLTPVIFLTSPDDIRHALKMYGTELATEFAKIIEESVAETVGTSETTEQLAQHVPIIQMVNSVIDLALTQNVSDIHIEPGDDRISIRFRVDGLLKNVVELPHELLAPFITRLKILARLKIDEHRVPQDGRFDVAFRNREVAIRLATMPTLYGTKAVLRLLDAKDRQLNFRALGLNARDLKTMRDDASRPHGLILVTGPTGSGKTTTLYALLKQLNKEDVNICTVEDPIEYGIEGVNQTQVNPTAGLTFANGLRSLLRQDPNVIMVGEIRDKDTASMAMNAAMTGHLVLSTLHTNNAFIAPQRLIEMGVEPFLVGSVTNLVIGQRLVRRVCRFCGEAVALSLKQREKYEQLLNLPKRIARLTSVKLLPEGFSFEKTKVMYGRGCDRCGKTGYLGRIGIYELLQVTPEIHTAMLKDASEASMTAASITNGMLTMLDDGVLKVLTGQTTFDEVLRVTE